MSASGSSRAGRLDAMEWIGPEALRVRPLRLVLAWLVSAASLLVAAWLLPGVGIDVHGAALGVTLVIGILNAVLRSPHGGAAAAVHARVRIPARARPRCAVPGGRVGHRAACLRRRRVLLGAPDGARRVGGQRRPRRALPVATTTTRTRCASCSGSRGVLVGATDTDAAGIVFLEIDGLALPVLRRAIDSGSAPGDGALARRAAPTRSRSGRPTSRRRPAPARPGSCSDRTRTFRRSAGSRRRRAPSRLLEPAGLRGDRAAALDRHRTAARWRRKPGQPALRRGGSRDPDRQPDLGGEDCEPGVPSVSRERLQRRRGCSPSSSGRCFSSCRRPPAPQAGTYGHAAIAV